MTDTDSPLDIASGSEVDTAYDSVGRVHSVSNPYYSTSDPTYGVTQYSYDALGRVTGITYPDNNTASISYSGACATYTNAASKSGKTCSDGLGRITKVFEDPTGLNYETDYTYDVLNNLTHVSQGSQSRSFQYDGLGRLTQATTPESGTVYYTYDSDSTCGSSAGDLVKRVDARNTRTCYTYDTIHRAAQKSYSDGTATANYYYDQSSYNGLTINNGKGRRTGMSDGSGQTAWNYDAMGRALTEEKTISGTTRTIADTFNYDGSLASLTYPSGRTVTYGVDSLGRSKSAVDSTNNINYALSATYAAQGALASVLNGQTGSFGGITYSLWYNNRLFPSSISASSSNGTALSLSYSFYGNGSADAITNNRDNGRTVTYGYDSLNRWNSASSQATSGSDCWGQSVPAPTANPPGYDRYGNLLTINVSKCSAPSLSISVNGSNQVSGFSYNSAGDLTNDGSHNYTWDAEGRAVTVDGGSTRTFTYNALGERVEWAYPGGASEMLFDPSGAWLGSGGVYSLVNFGAGHGVTYGGGETYFNHYNSLGSSSTQTKHDGSVVEDMAFYPFGTVWAEPLSGYGYNFASLPARDLGSNTDITAFRQYNFTLGRWLSPDPLAGDITNPQSLNRYAYVLNNPTSLIDPLGLTPIYCPLADTYASPACAGLSPFGSTGISGGITVTSNWQTVSGDYYGDPYTYEEETNSYVFGLGFPGIAVDDTGGSGTAGTGKSQPCGTTGWLHGGVGITAGGNADVGLLTGATAAVSQSWGVFRDNSTGFSGGSATTDVALAYFGSHVPSTPPQAAQPFVLGAYAGAGFSFFFTNARSVQQLSGPFQTKSLNVGYGPWKFSVQWATGGNIKVLTIGPPYAGASIGGSISRTTTNTTTSKGGCGPG